MKKGSEKFMEFGQVLRLYIDDVFLFCKMSYFFVVKWNGKVLAGNIFQEREKSIVWNICRSIQLFKTRTLRLLSVAETDQLLVNLMRFGGKSAVVAAGAQK